MSQELAISVAADVIVLLSKTNVAVTGLTFSDVTCEFRKEGGASFSVKTLSGANFTEIGSGTYTVRFTAAELDTIGTFTVIVDGATIDQSTTIAQVNASTQATTPVSLETCIINGHVQSLSGEAVQNVSVTALILGLPSVEQSQAVITENSVAAQTDSNGEFFLTLVRLADVEVFIPETNYRRRFVVPNQANANLFTDVS